MEEDEPNDSQEVFSKAQMKAIAAVVRGLLEEVLMHRPHRCSTAIRDKPLATAT